MPDWALPLISVGASLMVAVASGLAAARVAVARARAELEKEVLARLDERRRQVYNDFIKMMQDILPSFGKGTPDSAKIQKLRRRMVDFRMASLLVSSDHVIDAFTKWGRGEQPAVDQRYAVLRDFADIVLAMRRDMGYKDTKLTRTDILRMFVTDLDEQTDLLAFLGR